MILSKAFMKLTTFSQRSLMKKNLRFFYSSSYKEAAHDLKITLKEEIAVEE